MAKTHILGFPRIGAQRELKKSLENYWNHKINQEELLECGRQIRQSNWKIQHDSGLDFVTVGDFSYYDHVLDTSALLGVIPSKYKHDTTTAINLNTIFSMARGKSPDQEDVTALAMTKWFNTNYHYMVPEFEQNQQFKLSSSKLFDEIQEAKSLGYNVKPVIIGPLTYLWLGRSDNFDKLSLLPQLIETYNEILAKLFQLDITHVQIDEPILTLELSQKWQEAFGLAYKQLKTNGIKLILTTYFGDLGDNLKLIKSLPVAGLHIDICSNSKQLVTVANEWSCNKILSVGIINGRNIWKNDLNKSFEILKQLKTKFDENLWVASSTSLLHSPVDLTNEKSLNPEIKRWLSFAIQKIEEISILGRGVNYGINLIKDELEQNAQDIESKSTSTLIHDSKVQNRISTIDAATDKRKNSFEQRIKSQDEKLNLPLFPTTTIGSFPQTSAIRKIRQEFKHGLLTKDAYIKSIQKEIKSTISHQEKLGIDVLVHGEAERNDMVEYFGELLNGFAFTSNGWVQSYGSRCVKPPIIYGDVKRPKAMTVKWTLYAQSLTNKQVKGMLTGPITILSWSFVRDDQAIKDTALQIALALRDEVCDLENAGINIIQIDEPAFREALPLKKNDWQEYLDWAVYAFRIASSGVSDSTQIHTHMCYSSFNDVIQAIADLDADVITIETSRGNLELLKAFETFNYPNQIGPGVYDIHSPRIPSTEEIINQVNKMLAYIPKEKLWINPDCGLKTRGWPEVEQALHNMQLATNQLREQHGI
ncbi:MAG: 5-methyltetrahydropteroyltriglutamate--homocysteine S-methyltransferase [Burkholderiales bacterium]|nr:5-methyltetrahydropteroyltriglutamate--homocysteine S-methyltransferase [Burkholderiales bacterium]